MRGRSRTNEQDIQNTAYHYSLIDEPTPQVLENLEIRRPFVFESLPNIHRFNCCPLDPFHDLGEGAIPDILKFIFYYWANNRTEKFSAETISTKINNFPFYEGNPVLISSTKRYPGQGLVQIFNISASGIQVLNMLVLNSI